MKETVMSQDLEIKQGVLTVKSELDFDYDVGFDRACNELIISEQKDLVIDLSAIRHITSTCIAMMAATYIRAEAEQKKLSVIAQGSVLRALKLAGFDNLMKVTDSGRFRAIK